MEQYARISVRLREGWKGTREEIGERRNKIAAREKGEVVVMERRNHRFHGFRRNSDDPSCETITRNA